MSRIIPNLWINDGKIEEAVDFWVGVFDDSRIVSSSDYGPDAGQWAGQKMAINFELRGDSFTAINGGDTSFTPTEAVSLAVPCETQDEIDHQWKGLCDGGEPGPCGWLKDRYGFSWQVYPTELDQMLQDSDPAKVRRVTECFMAVNGRAFEIEELRAAYEGR